MANQKISNLKSLNAETVSREDLIPIVDVSSATAVGGELKKIAVNQLILNISEQSYTRISERVDDKYDKTGGNIRGDVNVEGNLSVAQDSTFLKNLTVGYQPINNNHVATKLYVDTVVTSSYTPTRILNVVNPELNKKYNITGGGITGNVSVGGTLLVQGSATFNSQATVPLIPESAGHAASKQYVDTLLSTVNGLANGAVTGLQDKYDKAGGTITGNVDVNGTLNVDSSATFSSATFSSTVVVPILPLADAQAASKKYVDDTVSTATSGLATNANLNNKYDKAGGVISGKVDISTDLAVTGSLFLSSAPTLDNHATRKSYVDVGLNGKFNTSGGSITGNTSITGSLVVSSSIFSARSGANITGSLNVTGSTSFSVAPTAPNPVGTTPPSNTLTNIDYVKKLILDNVFPIGSIFTTTDSSNPSDRFTGTTWEAFGAGSVLVGLNSADGDFNVVEKIGGSKTHTLSTNEIPAHTHGIPALTGTTSTVPNHTHLAPTANNNTTGAAGVEVPPAMSNGYLNVDFGKAASTSEAGSHDHTLTTSTSTTGGSGGSSAHNNLQPYIVVRFWKRTA